MSRERLELALEKLSPAQWERFETFASEFLVAEMPDLRTVASPSGDSGRDAELFSPDGGSSQVLQYSIAKDWRGKIRATAKRVSETLSSAQMLIYVTNQRIGADVDELRSEIRVTYSLHLDVRDRTYFLDRFRKSPQTEAASEELLTGVNLYPPSAPVAVEREAFVPSFVSVTFAPRITALEVSVTVPETVPAST